MTQAYKKEKKDPIPADGRVMFNVGIKPELALEFDTFCNSIDMTRSEVLRMLMVYALKGTNKKNQRSIKDIHRIYLEYLIEVGLDI
jgi:hypothetical protein